MKSYFLFKEFIWLVNLIRKKGKISLSDINEEWLNTEMSEGIDFSRSTFLRHKNAIAEMFGLIIECDTHNEYKYYISNAHVLKEDSIQNWMLSTITVNNLLTENICLADRILLESVPSEGEYLCSIIDAMKKKVRIKMTHQKYGTDNCSNVTFAPYCLRLFQCRWYVLGQFQRPVREGETPIKRKGLPQGYFEYYVTYSLDRVKSMELTDEKFEMDEGFSATAYFKDCFGVYNVETVPVQKVVIRAFDLQRYYMHDLPWHHSQKEINKGEGYCDFEFTLRPTADFIRHIMRYGTLVQVLSPVSLAKEVRRNLLESADIYKHLDDEN